MASQYPGSEHFTATPPATRRGWQVPALIAGLLVLVGGGAWLIVAGAARDAQESVATSAAVLRAQPLPYKGFEAVFDRSLNIGFTAP
jgi:hypothetical protein